MSLQLTLTGELMPTCAGCGLPCGEPRCDACRVVAGEELEECGGCQTPTLADDLYGQCYYLGPFEDEETESAFKLCQDCREGADDLDEDLFECDGCFRTITDSRGHHMHYRDTEAGRFCLRCVEETLKAEGLAGFEDKLEGLFAGNSLFGMFFNVGELEAEGWVAASGYSDRRIGEQADALALGAVARALHEAGERIIVGYERLSIVGDEGYVTLYHTGPAARCDRCGDPGPDGQPCERCDGQGTHRTVDHARIAAIAASRRTDKGQRGLLPYSIGLANVTGSMLGRFATEAEAATYIETLEGYEDGRYYLDGPPFDLRSHLADGNRNYVGHADDGEEGGQ